MKKKEMKALAKQIAKLEQIIQTSADSTAVYNAKNEMIHLTEASELEMPEMLELDEMVAQILKEKNN